MKGKIMVKLKDEGAENLEDNLDNSLYDNWESATAVDGDVANGGDGAVVGGDGGVVGGGVAVGDSMKPRTTAGLSFAELPLHNDSVLHTTHHQHDDAILSQDAGRVHNNNDNNGGGGEAGAEVRNEGQDSAAPHLMMVDDAGLTATLGGHDLKLRGKEKEGGGSAAGDPTNTHQDGLYGGMNIDADISLHEEHADSMMEAADFNDEVVIEDTTAEEDQRVISYVLSKTKTSICRECDNPVATFGHLEPCLHMFCLDCADMMHQDVRCALCKSTITKVTELVAFTKDRHVSLFECDYRDCRKCFLSHDERNRHRQQSHSGVSSSGRGNGGYEDDNYNYGHQQRRFHGNRGGHGGGSGGKHKRGGGGRNNNKRNFQQGGGGGGQRDKPQGRSGDRNYHHGGNQF